MDAEERENARVIGRESRRWGEREREGWEREKDRQTPPHTQRQREIDRAGRERSEWGVGGTSAPCVCNFGSTADRRQGARFSIMASSSACA